MGVFELGIKILPPPVSSDFNTSEGLVKSMAILGPKDSISPFLAHFIGTLIHLTCKDDADHCRNKVYRRTSHYVTYEKDTTVITAAEHRIHRQGTNRIGSGEYRHQQRPLVGG